jgi:hypothetical protein
MDIEKHQRLEIQRLSAWLSRIHADHSMANRVKLYARLALEGAPLETRAIEPPSGLEESLVSFADAVARRAEREARMRRTPD